MVLRNLVVAVVVFISATGVHAASLSELIGGQSIELGGISFTNWRLEQDLGSISPALDQIMVTLQQADDRHVALSFAGEAALAAAGSEELIFSVGVDIMTPVGLRGLAVELNQPTATGDGLVDSVTSLADTSGAFLAEVGTVLDPSFGVSQLSNSAEFSPRKSLGASTSLSVFGPGSLAGVTQTFTIVPEPSSAWLVVAGCLGVGAMRQLRRIRWAGLAVILLSVSASRAADHFDSPSVEVDGRLDLNDIYVFQSPSNASNVVFIATVNPLAGVMTPTTFHPTGRYEFNIDTDADAIADITFEVTFGPPGAGGTQACSLRRNGALIARGLTGSTIRLRSAGSGRLRAGVFEDPFFFDLLGFRDNLNFTGDDFFAGLNVSAIVLEVPRSSLGADNIGVWGRTVLGGEQFDREGRPAINTALIARPRKDAFNAGDPIDDIQDFGEEVMERIVQLSGDEEHAAMLTPVLLPDIMTIDTSSPAGFLNGRWLEDDVIDIALTVLTASPEPIGDGVDGNDAEFRLVFPYLAPPNP